MPSNTPPRTGTGRTRSAIAAALVVLGAVLFGALGHQSVGLTSPSLASELQALSPSSAAPSIAPQPPPPSSVSSTTITAGPLSRPPGHVPRDRRRAPDESDGVVANRTTVFDTKVPAVAKLDPTLLGALRQAATSAARDGVTFYVTSGWRSPAYQQQLLSEAVAKYGSAAEAARWVATPTTSAHVSGDAVDIGSSDATAWLSRHGADFGLCQIYGNEPWHYERRPDAVDHGCPPMYADPTHDPRMQP